MGQNNMTQFEVSFKQPAGESLSLSHDLSWSWPFVWQILTRMLTILRWYTEFRDSRCMHIYNFTIISLTKDIKYIYKDIIADCTIRHDNIYLQEMYRGGHCSLLPFGTSTISSLRVLQHLLQIHPTVYCTSKLHCSLPVDGCSGFESSSSSSSSHKNAP